MTLVAVRSELRFRLPNSPGALARVVDLLGTEQVRVLALSLEPSGLLHLVVDNPARAATALERELVAVEQRNVICTMVAMRSIGSLLASAASAGINIEYAYASTGDADWMVALVLGVDDAQRAASAAGL